jgi:hypothetical protein
MMIPIHTGDIQTTIQLMRTHIEAAHMTTSSDQLAILLTLIIESKELSFLDRSFASAKELKFLSRTNLCFVAAAAAGCDYGMDSIKAPRGSTLGT